MHNALRVALLLGGLVPLAALAGATPPGPDAMPRQEGASAPPPPPTTSGPPGTSAVAPQPAAENDEAQKPAFMLPASPETGIHNAEQARLRLQDICMYSAVSPNAPEGVSAPRCACYAQAFAKSMTADDIAAFAASDEVPESARDHATAIWERCKAPRG